MEQPFEQFSDEKVMENISNIYHNNGKFVSNLKNGHIYKMILTLITFTGIIKYA